MLAEVFVQLSTRVLQHGVIGFDEFRIEALLDSGIDVLALFSVAQLSVMATTRLLTPTLLGYSILATITIMIFTPVGIRFSRNLSKQAFEWFLLSIFLLIEIKLVYDIFA